MGARGRALPAFRRDAQRCGRVDVQMQARLDGRRREGYAGGYGSGTGMKKEPTRMKSRRLFFRRPRLFLHYANGHSETIVFYQCAPNSSEMKPPIIAAADKFSKFCIFHVKQQILIYWDFPSPM